MDPSVTLIDLMYSVDEDHLFHFYTPEVALCYCCTWSLMEHFTLVSSYYPRHGLRLRIPCGAPLTQGGGGCSVARLIPRPALTCSMKGRTEVAPQEEVEEQGVSKAVPGADGGPILPREGGCAGWCVPRGIGVCKHAYLPSNIL